LAFLPFLPFFKNMVQCSIVVRSRLLIPDSLLLLHRRDPQLRDAVLDHVRRAVAVAGVQFTSIYPFRQNFFFVSLVTDKI
jgi:hypothetical protein